MNIPQKKSWLFNLFLIILLIGAVGLFVWGEQRRRSVASQLATTEQELQEIRKSTQNNGKEAAQAILEKVRRHLEIPTDPAPTVATITDIERLRETNEFYKQAKNGDNLIITEKRAILYDAERDLILDMVPVRLNAQPSGSPGASTSPLTSPGAIQTSPSVSPSSSPAASSSTPRP